MSELSGVTLTFVFIEVAGGFRLEVERSGRVEHTFWGSSEGLAEVRHGLKRRLDDVKEAVMRGAREDAFVEFGTDLDRALAALHDEGLDVLAQMAGSRPQAVKDLVGLLKRLLGPRPREAVAPVVQVIAPQKLWVPVELLAAPVESVRVRCADELRDACSRFLGFAAVVQRVIARPEGDRPLGLTQDRELGAGPSLPLIFFQDDSLEAVRAEYDRLTALAPRLTVHGPWPSARYPTADPVRTFMTHLGDPWAGLGGERLEPPIQIQHFACHCDTRSDDARQHALRLAGAGAGSMDIAIQEIRRERTRTAAAAVFSGARREPHRELPLVFLNACSSSTMDHRAAASFPELFLTGGHRGFIGTQSDIPDAFAERFAARFYYHLLAGDSTGRSLNAAKWEMVNERQNPLGILYTMYADPDLAVGRNEEGNSG